MRLIDADELIRQLIETEGDPCDVHKYCYPCKEILELIGKQTPIEERKQGKWISHSDYCIKHGYIPSGLIALWWCDQCEQAEARPTNFCPDCGADMRGKQDETD